MGEFGGAVEAEGEAYGADAAIDVELHVVEVEDAFDVLLAHGGKDQGADDGEADLAAVGVAGEHEVDEREAGVQDDPVHVIGLMAHEEHRCMGPGGDGVVEIGLACASVVGSTEPEDVAASLEGRIAVDEDGRSVGLEGANDVLGADTDVVVAEDAEALRRLERREDLGSCASGLPCDGEGAGATADEVASDKDEVRGECIDLGDHAFEEKGFGVLLEVNIAHLDDAKALERVGEIADRDSAVGDLEFVACMRSSVGSEANTGGGRCGDKTTARKGWSLRMTAAAGNTVHRP